MAIQLIALDIDGTLLDSKWQVSDRNLRAIADATKRGIEVALVTGRRYTFALPIASKIPSPLTLILNNGAVVKSRDGETLLSHSLPRQIARSVLLATPEFREGTAVHFDRTLDRQVIYERIDWNDPTRRSYFERNREFLAEVSPLERCLDEDITADPIQVMFTGPVARMREAASKLGALAHGGPPAERFSMALTFYDHRNFGLVDVIQAGCSKGATLAEWAAARGIPRESVMAIGDNLNDREMLSYAGVPVVMGNSVPELKSLGWAETLSNDESGVAHAIEAYALGAS
ncbi:MAG: Cof-type HAD-IIB family hydrolase [Candidatus Acidiferrales bacterium]